MVALVGGHRWVAQVGGTGEHRWVGTGGWHCWGTGRWHFWAQVCDTAEWHRWAELVGALLGTGGRNLWVALL
ncbi:unnamed protein product, partial [Staurois parvus]